MFPAFHKIYDSKLIVPSFPKHVLPHIRLKIFHCIVTSHHLHLIVDIFVLLSVTSRPKKYERLPSQQTHTGGGDSCLHDNYFWSSPISSFAISLRLCKNFTSWERWMDVSSKETSLFFTSFFLFLSVSRLVCIAYELLVCLFNSCVNDCTKIRF